MDHDNRYKWVDVAKAIGIFLVFYGHIVERLYLSGVSSAFVHFKFIYSFHMPLFFIMAGFFATSSPLSIHRVKVLASRRLIPAITFGVLLLPLWMINQKRVLGTVDWRDIAWRCLDYLHGDPNLNWTTWFLVCLFTCEIFSGLFFPNLQTRKRTGVFGIVVLFLGLEMCDHMGSVVKILGVLKNTWFIHEGVVALGLYSIGYAVFPYLLSMLHKRTTLSFSLMFFSLMVLTLSFGVNKPEVIFVVIMESSSHGEILTFLISALAGFLFIVVLASILPSIKCLLFLGKNTIVLLGLNGVFFHFVNQSLVARLLPADNHLFVLAYCFTITCLSLAACVPFILIANKYIPQLVGHPNKEGPILRNLLTLRWNVLAMLLRQRI